MCQVGRGGLVYGLPMGCSGYCGSTFPASSWDCAFWHLVAPRGQHLVTSLPVAWSASLVRWSWWLEEVDVCRSQRAGLEFGCRPVASQGPSARLSATLIWVSAVLILCKMALFLIEASVFLSHKRRCLCWLALGVVEIALSFLHCLQGVEVEPGPARPGELCVGSGGG